MFFSGQFLRFANGWTPLARMVLYFLRKQKYNSGYLHLKDGKLSIFSQPMKSMAACSKTWMKSYSRKSHKLKLLFPQFSLPSILIFLIHFFGFFDYVDHIYAYDILLLFIIFHKGIILNRDRITLWSDWYQRRGPSETNKCAQQIARARVEFWYILYYYK